MQEAFLLAAVLVVLCAILWFITFRGPRGYTHRDDAWNTPQIIENILTTQECKQIIDKATPLFSRSSVVGANGPDASRTSETAWIPKTDPIAQKILEKASEISGKPLENCEDLQVVRYEPGAYYKQHHDACCDASQGCDGFQQEGGQRMLTLLVYLNDEFTDGETHFPELDIKMKADPGSAIMFWPLGKDDDRCHPKALHAGLPPSSGVKYVCNAWVRENKFR